MNMKKILALAVVAMALVACGRPAQTSFSGEVQTLKSPDGNLTLSVGLTADGTPAYSLDFGDRAVVLPISEASREIGLGKGVGGIVFTPTGDVWRFQHAVAA